MVTETKKPAPTKTETAPNVTKISGERTPGASADASREELEQRRSILQNMKDFDFQIKKNQEEITHIVEKVESLSKDLDDLVSLYEIVSEQMNPFVGLSKVTKKRLDALENFTKEVDAVKIRIGDLENMVEKTGLNIAGGIPPTPVTLKAIPNVRTETQVEPKMSPVVVSSVPGVIQPAVEKMTDREMDQLLNTSLESLLMEQNIDTMINEFFINLK
jgi:archaellum component FlaC